MKKLELYLFVIFVTFLLPLFISLKTIDPGLFPRFILLALCVIIIEAIAIVRIAREGFNEKHTVVIHSLYYFLGGYLLFTALSLLKAANSAECIFEILRVALFVACTIIAFRIINRSEKDRISLSALWVGYFRINGDMNMVKALHARKAARWELVINRIDLINTMLYSVDHTSTPVHWYRGVANFSLNRIPDALNDFKKAYEAHPYHIHVLNNLGTCYESLGDHSTAEHYYLKALEISPGFNETLINLAAVYYNMKKYKIAYDTIKRTNASCTDIRRESFLKTIKEKLQSDN